LEANAGVSGNSEAKTPARGRCHLGATQRQGLNLRESASGRSLPFDVRFDVREKGHSADTQVPRFAAAPAPSCLALAGSAASVLRVWEPKNLES